MIGRNGWIPLSVGCHWTKGDFTVSTVQQGRRTGYVLYQNRVKLAEFITWADVLRRTA